MPGTLVGYVLHQHDWSESSLIVELFTLELGRLVVVARGAKRPYSQLRAVLMPFQRLSIGIGRAAVSTAANGDGADRSATDIHTLRGAEWAGTHSMPQGAALFSGFYLNELLLKLLARQDPHADLFDAYARAVALLAALPEGSQAPVLRAFEWWLLREIGLLPLLAIDTLSQEAVVPSRTYRLGAEVGVSRRAQANQHDTDRAGFDGSQLLAVEAALQARDFNALVQTCAGGERDMKPALREVLHYHLGASRLHTRELLRELQNLSVRSAA